MEKDFFTLPNMVLHRDDIKALYSFTDEYKKKVKEIDNYTEEEMQAIADKLSKALMSDWDLCLRAVVNSGG